MTKLKKILSFIGIFIGVLILALSGISQYSSNKQLSVEIERQKESIRNIMTVETDIASAFLKYANKNKGASYILAGEAVKTDSRKCNEELSKIMSYLESLRLYADSRLVLSLLMYLFVSIAIISSLLIIIIFPDAAKKVIKRKSIARKKTETPL
jgi:hypothetical protein